MERSTLPMESQLIGLSCNRGCNKKKTNKKYLPQKCTCKNNSTFKFKVSQINYSVVSEVQCSLLF